jgi:hypothetical protein
MFSMAWRNQLKPLNSAKLSELPNPLILHG